LAENWGLFAPFLEMGELGPLSFRAAEAYLPTKWHLDPSTHLATTDGPKIGGSCAHLGVELGPQLTQCGLAEA